MFGFQYVWVSGHELLTGGYPTHIHCLKLYLNCTTLHQYYSALHCTELHLTPSLSAYTVPWMEKLWVWCG